MIAAVRTYGPFVGLTLICAILLVMIGIVLGIGEGKRSCYAEPSVGSLTEKQP